MVWNRIGIWRTRRHTPTNNSEGYPDRDLENQAAHPYQQFRWVPGSGFGEPGGTPLPRIPRGTRIGIWRTRRHTPTKNSDEYPDRDLENQAAHPYQEFRWVPGSGFGEPGGTPLPTIPMSTRIGIWRTRRHTPTNNSDEYPDRDLENQAAHPYQQFRGVPGSGFGEPGGTPLPTIPRGTRIGIWRTRRHTPTNNSDEYPDRDLENQAAHPYQEFRWVPGSGFGEPGGTPLPRIPMSTRIGIWRTRRHTPTKNSDEYPDRDLENQAAHPYQQFRWVPPPPSRGVNMVRIYVNRMIAGKIRCPEWENYFFFVCCVPLLRHIRLCLSEGEHPF